MNLDKEIKGLKKDMVGLVSELRAIKVDVNEANKRLDNIDPHSIEDELDVLRKTVTNRRNLVNKDATVLRDILKVYISRSTVFTQCTWFISHHAPDKYDNFLPGIVWAYDSLPDEFWLDNKATIAEWCLKIQNAYNNHLNIVAEIQHG